MNNFIVVRDRNMASVKEGFLRRIYFNVPKWSTITDKLFNPWGVYIIMFFWQWNLKYSVRYYDSEIYLPMGLLMIGNLLGVVSAYATGNSLPVPQFWGWKRTKYPLDGSICLSVEYSSHRVLGWDLNTLCPGPRSNVLNGGSVTGIQCCSA